MLYKNTLSFARSMDRTDPLKGMRNLFHFPNLNGKRAIYLCGNSLGLQPKSVSKELTRQLENWKSQAVEGWFDGDEPWMYYHKALKDLMAPIVGAKPEEVCPMNTLTVNLHLLMVSFYKPKGKRFKIIMEAGAFPSDQYAIESQVRFHGFDPADAIIEVSPRDGEFLLRTDDILSKINEHKDSVALLLFGGINYFTGQFFDMEAITDAGHRAGALVGFDLAHAAGNVPLRLHDWKIDFACWCSYKYQNSGPGGISGIFVHEKHFGDQTLHRFAGWWGYNEERRFQMKKGFEPSAGADGWQVSCAQIIPLSMYYASLKLFKQAGGMEALRMKSEHLTGYLYYIINQVNSNIGYEQFNIISPADPADRGAQLSIIAEKDGKRIFEGLLENQVLGDWREPNVIRLSPVPMYNSFEDVYRVGKSLLSVCEKLK